MNSDEVILCLEALGFTNVSLKRGGSTEVVASCLFHDDSIPSFGVSLVKEGHPCSCFAECFRGNLVSLAKRVLGLSFGRAFDFVKKFGDIELVESSASFSPKKIEAAWAVEFQFYLDQFRRMSPFDRRMLDRFLRDRLLDPKDLYLSKRVGWNPESKCLIFPWHNRGMRGHSWRGVGNALLKQYDPRFQKPSESLFFTKKPDRTVVVTEGPLDALAVTTSTGLAAVAIGHASPSRAQADLICRLAETVILMLDNDAGGIRGVENAARILGDRVTLRFSPKLDGKDPSRSSPQRVRRAVGLSP